MIHQAPIVPQQEFRQEFRYRRVVGTILAIVLLAAAVTGAAIGLSSRNGNNPEVAASDSSQAGNPDSGQKANNFAYIQSDAQLGAQQGDKLLLSPELGENVGVVGSASPEVQTLELRQNAIEGDNVLEGVAESDASASRAVSASVNEAVQKLLPSSVSIFVRPGESQTASSEDENLEENEEERGFSRAGSGIIFDDSGLILSAAHVFTDNEGNHVTSDEILIEFDSGFFANGRLLGYDTGSDVAVIRFDPSNLDFKAADLADLSELMVGDQVIAIGAPFGYVNSVNVGHVSGINRTELRILDDDLPASVPTIQTDAPINSGNSGGMLANLDGEVLGINVFIRTTGAFSQAPGGNVGLGFAVPIDIAMRVAEKILAGEQFFYGALGVIGRLELEAGPPGPTVVSVVPGGAADLAGIEPGDNIIEFEGKKVRTMNDLAAFVQFHPPGEYASIVVYRNRQEVRVTATIGTSAKESLTVIVN